MSAQASRADEVRKVRHLLALLLLDLGRALVQQESKSLRCLVSYVCTYANDSMSQPICQRGM